MRIKYKLALAVALISCMVIVSCTKDNTEPPTVKLFENVITINYTDATVSAEVVDDGGGEVRSRGFVYGKSGSLRDTVFCGSGTGVFSSELRGLESNTSYTYEAFARNEKGVGVSGKLTFTTLELSVPKVKTVEVGNPTTSSVTCVGKVLEENGSPVTQRGVCWGIGQAPTIEGDHIVSGEGLGEFQCEITDLEANTKYYVRAYAINGKGTAYGEELDFMTSPLYTVQVKAEPVTGGEVTVSNEGVFAAGESCKVTATPKPGYSFVNWTENGNEVSTNADFTFDVSGNRVLVAHFNQNSYTITVSANPSNAGTASVGGNGNSGNFTYNEPCTLKATPKEGYRFVNWTKNGTAVSGEKIYTINVTESASYVAHFQLEAFSLVVTATPTVIAQGGNAQLKAVASGSDGNFIYRWSPSSSLSNANVFNPKASPSTTTTYTCSVTSAGVTEQGSCTVTVVCPPTSLNATLQGTNSVKLTWTAANPAASYKVYRDNALLKSGVTSTAYTDSNVAPGTHNYRIATVYGNVESPKSNAASVIVYSSLNVTVTATNNVIPEGGNTVLKANPTGGSGSYTYSWTPTSSLSNPHAQTTTATPTSTTTYKATVSSAGQQANAQVTVSVVKAPANLTAVVQGGTNVKLTWTASSPVTSYKVYRGNSLVASNIQGTTYTDANLNPGTYTYKVSTVYQGVESPRSNPAEATIIASLSVTASADQSVIPDGGSTVLRANATGGTGNYTYSWTPASTLNNSHVVSPTATPTSTTTYTVTVSSGGNQATAEVTVTVVKAPTGLNAEVQETSNVNLSWTASSPATSYKVYRGNSLVVSNIQGTTYTDTNLAPGTYTYRVSAVYQGVESPRSNPVEITVETPVPLAPTGAINGLFSVSASQQVYFSQGNLQYKASTNTWRFAEHQWDCIGDANSNISQSYSGWIDLFGWGTSGYNHGAVCYQPWSTSTSNSDYYAYGQSTYNLYDQTGQADWGYNAISNGGNSVNTWRTLTHEEWGYVFNTRNTASGVRYAKAKVSGVNGVILLPDDWNTSYYSLNNTNSSDASYSSNTITANVWENSLESHGAVFLPAAGYRFGTSLYDVGSHGDYWSASYGSSYYAWLVGFGGASLSTDGSYYRFSGQSVRLVRFLQ